MVTSLLDTQYMVSEGVLLYTLAEGCRLCLSPPSYCPSHFSFAALNYAPFFFSFFLLLLLLLLLRFLSYVTSASLLLHFGSSAVTQIFPPLKSQFYADDRKIREDSRWNDGDAGKGIGIGNDPIVTRQME